MGQVNFFIAFAAGVASFLSPCVLPLVPGYLSLMSGLSFQELTAPPGTDAGRAALSRRAGMLSLFFVAGFSTVFTMLGAFASGLGSPLAAHMPLFRKAAGGLIVLFGLHAMGVLPVKWLYYQKSFNLSRFRPGRWGAFLMGMAFAFGWTPCVGPILASVLALAVTEGTAGRGMGLLFVYSLGLGVPFVATGFAVGGFVDWMNRYRRYIRWTEMAAGGILVLIGVLIFTNRLAEIATALVRLS